MNRHYDRYLVKKYAPLYKKRYAPTNETAMCWGFCVGDGWFNIINTLSFTLCHKWIHAQHEYLDIKDRVGKLRWEGGKESEYNQIITQEDVDKAFQKMEDEALKVPVAVQVKEKFGGLRFYVEGATDEQYTVIQFAELLSERTCEVCGKKGKQNAVGWITTRCSEHRST